MARWAEIPGFPGYKVSADGMMYSFKSNGLLTLRERQDGRLDVHLCVNGRMTRQLVHRLVLLAFIGPAPENHETLHRNGIGTDNRLSNLHWGTRSENMHDRHRLGEIDVRGVRNPNYRHGQCCGEDHRDRREYMQAYRQKHKESTHG